MISVRNGYKPDALISNYMLDKLIFEKRRRREKLRGIELAEDKKYSSLKKRKADVLNRIFTSMANLTYFFECIEEHEELKMVFEDDTLDLFGLRRESPQTNRCGYIFSRLMSSIIIGRTQFEQKLEDLVERQEAKANDFRLVLTDLLQQVVNDKVNLSLPNVIDRAPDAKKNVLKEFDAARGWTKMLELLVDKEMLNEAPHRTFNFDTNKLLNKKD